ncbi:MAG: 2Fe-2S iron-sulfur cluster-binding protein [Planctomycetota bacterium]|nr:2Fe-2S iron-sulfur cluster-binding protein [Planctomycetota bacterium]MDA0933635.1 2Fe-2S iron-sulfur cluster-binding protein [Planctomycetota bacterium]MDA1221755.1 2Fe-2S iron-sulfur cluster-binding protein [Planctomycetota bacterium]
MTPGISIHFVDHGTFEAAVGDSILDVAMRHEVPLDHACGAVCACSTCHVRVEAGADALSEASEDEEDQLDAARDLGLDSRLGCQARLERAPAGGEVRVRIPSWNVNLVREGG